MAEVRLDAVSKRFGTTAAVHALSLQVADGELIALLGPSGCGKTTTLRCIGGFVDPDEGEIYFGPRRITHLPPEHRSIGMVFQHYALFPHMTVFDNVAFGLRMRRLAAGEVRRRVDGILAKVQLADLAARYPRQLSGGQQQRVALSRALVTEPAVLLLDEPLANLDAKLREEMRFYIRSLQKEVGITTIYVTHDQAEAMVIADRIAVMFNGTIEQLGVPREIYRSPGTRRVADFIGLTNFIPGRLTEIQNGAGLVETAVGRLRCVGRSGLSPGYEVLVAVRPEGFRVGSAEGSGEDNVLDGIVLTGAYLGNLYDYRVELRDGQVVRVQGSVERGFAAGERIRLSVRAADAWVIPAGSQ
jgi:ABC-type Fe3+/spermidine/putrescine transport system ATPase subunit